MGFQEALIIIVIVVVILGANRLPELGQSMGRSMLDFRRGLNGTDEVDITPKKSIDIDGQRRS